MMRNKKETYRHIYKVTYLANINKNINENKYINILQKLNTEGFKTYHIDDFEKLILCLYNNKLYDSYNISLLIYLRDINYKELSSVALMFNDIGEIFSYKKKNMITRVHEISKVIKDKINLMMAFKKIEKYHSVINSINFVNYEANLSNACKKHNNVDNKICDNAISDDNNTANNHIINNASNIINKSFIDNKTIVDEWKYYSRHDIMNRLHVLTEKYYTIEQLKFMNVNLKHINEINAMEYIELENFYISVILQIEKSLKEWESICRIYVDIEINYMECCHAINNGKTTKLDFKYVTINLDNSVIC